MSVQEFATKIKEKHPEYKDVDDTKLTERILQKYPTYRASVDISSTPEGPRGALGVASGFAKTIVDAPRQFSESGLNIGKSLSDSKFGQAFSDKITKPLVGMLSPDAQKNLGNAARSAEQIQQRSVQQPEMLQRNTQSEKAGETAANIGMFLLPGGAAARGAKALEGTAALGKLGKFAPIASRAVTEGIAGTAIGTGQTGNIKQGLGAGLADAGITTGLGLISPIAGRVAGKVFDTAKDASTKMPSLGLPRAAAGTAPTALQSGIAGAKSIASTIAGGVSRGVSNIGEAARKSAEIDMLPTNISQAVKIGIPEDLAKSIPTLSKKTKQSATRMLDIAEKSATDPFSKAQPKEVIGDAILERIAPITKQRDMIGKEIEATRKSLPNKNLDITDEYTNLRKQLEEKGVIVGKDGFTLRASGGSIDPSDLKEYAAVLKILRPVNGRSIRSVKFLDNQRKRFFDAYKKALISDKPFSDGVTNFIESMRSELGAKIGTVSDNYMPVQQQYAQLMDSLRKIVKTLGLTDEELRAIGLEDLDKLDATKLRGAEVAMRNLGNAASRSQGFLQLLEEAAKNAGYKSKDNLDQLIRMADVIEQMAGSSQTRSLRGEVARGMSESQGVLSDAAEGAKSGGLVGGGMALLRRIGGVKKEEQLTALRELLR